MEVQQDTIVIDDMFFQLPLSGSHINHDAVREDRIFILGMLSTPSLGITCRLG